MTEPTTPNPHNSDLIPGASPELSGTPEEGTDEVIVAEPDGQVEGICRVCGLRRQVFKVNRRTDGPRDRNRVYRSSICCECAARLVAAGETARFDPLALDRLAAFHNAHTGETGDGDESPVTL